MKKNFNVGDLINCKDCEGLIEELSKEDPWNWEDGAHKYIDIFKKAMREDVLEVINISDDYFLAKSGDEEFEIPVSEIDKFGLEKELASIAEVKAYQCQYCSMISKYKGNVKRHMSTCFSNPETKSCRSCAFFSEDQDTTDDGSGGIIYIGGGYWCDKQGIELNQRETGCSMYQEKEAV